MAEPAAFWTAAVRQVGLDLAARSSLVGEVSYGFLRLIDRKTIVFPPCGPDAATRVWYIVARAWSGGLAYAAESVGRRRGPHYPLDQTMLQS
jgi:hypothetical protein